MSGTPPDDKSLALCQDPAVECIWKGGLLVKANSGTTTIALILACLFGLLSVSSIAGAAVSQPQIIASGEDFILVEIEFDDVEISPGKFDGRSGSYICLPGTEREWLPGHPDLPIVSFALAVPPCDDIAVDYSVSGTREMRIDYVPPVPTVIPGREFGALPGYKLKRGESYQREGHTPEAAAEIRSVSWVRDCRVAEIVVHPASYSHTDRMLRTWNSLTLRVSFANPKTSGVSPRVDPVWETLYENLLLNYEDSKKWRRPKQGNAKRRTGDYFTTSTNWAKLYIDEEGLYKVTGSDLTQAGITGTISTSSLRVFWGGGFPRPAAVGDARAEWMTECSIKVEDANSDGVLGSSDYFVFHGLGPDTWKWNLEPIDGEADDEGFYENPYVGESVYWLTWESSGGGGFAESSKRMNEIDGTPAVGGQPVESFRHRMHMERNVAFDLAGIIDDWFWLVLKDHPIFNTARITVRTPGYAGGDGLIAAKYYGATSELFTPDHRIEVFINDVLSMDTMWDGKRVKVDSSSTDALVDGNNEVKIYLPGGWPEATEEEWVYLEWIELEYDRSFLAEGDYLAFPAESANQETYRIDGLSSADVLVVRVDDKYISQVIENVDVTSSANGYAAEFSDQAASSTRYLVAGPEGLLPVSLIEPDETSYHRNTMNSADYVVVCYDEFVDGIEPIVSLRSARDGYETYVARVSDVFDEFSWGMADPAAIRDFMAYCDSLWQEAPDFLFLIGDATYDHRNYASSSVNYVPTYHGFRSPYGDVYATDDWFVSLDPVESDRPDLGVGRLPVRTVAMLEHMVGKIYDYETTPPMTGWKNNVLLIGDDELHLSNYEYMHTNQIERFAEEKLPAGLDKTKVYLMEYPCDLPGCPQGTTKSLARAALLEEWNRGALIVNYTGHGSEIVMADERVFSFEDIESLENGDMQCFFMAPSCKVNRFDLATGEALGEAILLASNKGSVASFASTRDSGAHSNTALADRVAVALFGGEEVYPTVALPIGLAITAGKVSGDWHNNQEFVLLGDPAMILSAPAGRIEFDSTWADTVTFRRQGVFTFEGSVDVMDLSGGATNTVARGTTDTTVYVNPEAPLGSSEYILPGEVIFEGAGTVSDGSIITGALVVPLDSEEGNLGRLRIYAHRDFDDAVGIVENIETSGVATNGDEEGPSIWLSFGGATLVAPDAILEIALRDENGINILGGDHAITLTLDGSAETFDITSDFQYNEGSYQEGLIEFQLPDLWSGEHTVSVEAYDNLNNPNTGELVFSVTTTGGIREVANYPNPFETGTYFIFTLLQEPEEVEIKIFTVAGRLIRVLDDDHFDHPPRSGQNQVYWDGRDDQDDELANGVYLYKIIAKGQTGTVDAIGKAMLAR